MLTLLHLSDIHYRKEYPESTQLYAAMLHEMGDPMERLKKTLLKATEFPVDVVVVTGDSTDDGDDADFECVKSQIQKAFPDIPLLFVPGNHDPKEAYEKGLNCPYSTWTKDLFGLHWIGWNNTAYNSDGCHVTGEQLNGLRWAVDTNVPSILLMHHSVFAQTGIPAPEEQNEIREILEHSKVKLILAGHTHHDLFTEFAGIPYSVSGSQAFLADNNQDGSVVFKTSGTSTVLQLKDDHELVRHVLNVEKEQDIVRWSFEK